MQYLRNEMNEQEFAAHFRHQPLALIMKQLAVAFDLKGPMQLVTTACAASTHALALADMWIRSGKVKRCLVGGTELLCDLTVRGFDSFQLLAREQSKPFDKDRRGINLSEASAFLVLESSQEKASGLCALTGGGMSSDAYHMTSPDPQGRGCVAAMQKALRSASVEASHVDWVYAHGTGSLHNDSAEAAAIDQIFGESVLVSSTKACHGHALGVSGVLESVIAVQALRDGVILGNTNFAQAGDDIRVRIAPEHVKKPLRHILKNTLGFGGANGSVVFSAMSEVI
jgi:3-oxoacyl-[acyl-carrier-protein] synthase-1